ncbi:MAG: hypothetical protein ACJ8CB_22385 [Ktedonobacteraceae bacterium]
MEKPNIVVTFNISPEQKALFQQMLGSDDSFTFLGEIPPRAARTGLGACPDPPRVELPARNWARGLSPLAAGPIDPAPVRGR